MKISRNWLQTYFEKQIPPANELADLFTFHSFEVEGMDEIKDENGKVTDDILDVKVLPDRAHYALSMRGVAGETSVLTKQAVKMKVVPIDLKTETEAKPVIKILTPDFCRRYIGRFVELGNVKANTRIAALLAAIGQRSISPVVDATNYVMFDVGQPLHAFDADKVKGAIVVRAAKKGERIELLDSSEGIGREVELLQSDHVIADDLGPIAIAGVKGGKRTGISDTTKRLIIESANFEPSAIRRTATRLDLRSEASKRYENEITPELALIGMKNISFLINEASPDAKFCPIVDEYPVKAKQTMIELDPAYINERLGVDVPLAETKDILERMGIKIVVIGAIWRLEIPFERLDLTITDDIVEEIGRIYGYDKIGGVLPPKAPGSVANLPMFYMTEKLKNMLVEKGFSEVSLYSLVSKGEIETAHPGQRQGFCTR